MSLNQLLSETHQRFSIRKTRLGVGSVLLASLFLATNPLTVKAEEGISDTIDDRDKIETVLPTAAITTADAEGDEALSSLPSNEEERSASQPEGDNPTPFERTTSHLGAVTSITVAADTPNVFHIEYATGQKGQLSFYNDHVVRYHVVGADEAFRDVPEPSRPDRPAEIVTKTLDDFPTISPTLADDAHHYTISTDRIALEVDKALSTLRIKDLRSNKIVVEELAPLLMTDGKTTQTLKAGQDSHYFGGGTQNGRWTHKGHSINIVNENNWVDGGVASPNPFYFTTDGYGVLRHTFRPGRYDFEVVAKDQVTTSHQENRFDAFYFINDRPETILKDYYDLTGKPVVLPLFALYPGHLNAYNRDYWVEVSEGTHGAVYFKELGKWYKEYQPNQLGNRQGIRETLNGEKEDANYPFTARAVIDRYKDNDMPLGWILVNDGYGAGYGQTGSLEGNIQNLREFADYAKKAGILTGLWTQSDLHPDPSQPALLQRDLPNEVEKALVRVLKTDVAWVGPGYSFGLHGIKDAAKIMEEKGDGARPFIITLDGWGGTQRYGSIWTGDQTGGQWEYIRFHIPTYIGTGLSGQPNIGSDMDGIFGGSDKIINTRDFQWKTFTTLQLNMDGWGSNPKNPYAFDATTTDINRSYLKFKTALIPYSYSLGHASQDGKPIVRAMFLEFPEDKTTYTKAMNYQFMYGESLLVAPVYENVRADQNGNDVRNGIYLPKGADWIDYYTGKEYKGGQTLENYEAPIWKLPLFVRKGAIIPMTTPHNNSSEFDRKLRMVDFYPNGETSFELIEDDGLTQDYTKGKLAKTRITSVTDGDVARLTMATTSSQYEGFTKEKTVQFNVNVTEKPQSLSLTDNDQDVALTEVFTLEDFNKGTNVYFYDATPNLNRWSSQEGAFHGVAINKNPVLRVKAAERDVTRHALTLTITGFNYHMPAHDDITNINGDKPQLRVNDEHNGPTRIYVDWDKVADAKAYELEVDGTIHTGLTDNHFEHKELDYGSMHHYRVRAIVGDSYTPWSDVVASQTKSDPLALAIDGITVTSKTEAQAGTPLRHLVDKDVTTHYHSDWGTDALPESLVFDLKEAYELDRFEYVPRNDGGANGMITKAHVSFSTDGVHWLTYNQPVTWARDSKVKTFTFDPGRTARYIRLDVTESVGHFVSGNEFLVYKVEGSKSKVVGDVTADGVIDDNDRVSLLNYAGLRRHKDSDFKGYVEVADLNGNGLIDAYDTLYVTRELGQGNAKPITRASGQLAWKADKATVKAGDLVTYTLTGVQLTNVEAINAAIPIDTERFELVHKNPDVKDALSSMVNFSRIRQHGDGSTEAFVVLSNNKEGAPISGTLEIATLVLRAKVDGDTTIPLTDHLLVGTDMLPVVPNITEAIMETAVVSRIPNDRIQVTGADVYQPGYGVSHLNDNNPNTLTELLWHYEPNFVDGKFPEHVTLPQEIHFAINRSADNQVLKAMEIVKRTPGNGTMTKYKVTAYHGETIVHASEEQEVPFKEAVARYAFPEGVKADKVVLTILEARQSETTVNNTMLTLKDVHFYESIEETPTLQPAYTEEPSVSIREGIIVFADSAQKEAVWVQTSEEGMIPEVRRLTVVKVPTYTEDTYTLRFLGRDNQPLAIEKEQAIVFSEQRDIKAIYRVAEDGTTTQLNFDNISQDGFKGVAIRETVLGTYKVVFNSIMEPIPFETVRIKNDQLPEGETRVQVEGVVGERLFVTVDGVKSSDDKGIIVREAVTEVIEYNDTPKKETFKGEPVFSEELPRYDGPISKKGSSVTREDLPIANELFHQKGTSVTRDDLPPYDVALLEHQPKHEEQIISEATPSPAQQLSGLSDNHVSQTKSKTQEQLPKTGSVFGALDVVVSLVGLGVVSKLTSRRYKSK